MVVRVGDKFAAVSLVWHRPKPRVVRFLWWKFKWFGRTEYALGEDVVIASHKVPRGFVTDGASVPWYLRWLFSPMGPWAPAAWLHDSLLQKSGYTRAMAAKYFYRAMGELGIWRWVRKVFYWAVRVNDWFVERES